MIRAFNEIFRWLTGGLFIFSGLIKINDPVGTAIKLTEYFEVFSIDIAGFFHAFIPFALPLAVFLCVLEVVLGLALIINFKVRLTLSLLLGLIVFFTFLTFYSAYFNKVTDCGCFGDAIKLTPWESFYKDIILLVFIGFMFVFRKHFPEPKNERTGLLVVILTTILNVALAYYAIEHLPFIDFRAYKIGVHIPSAMQPSGNYEYTYIMRKDGQLQTFDQYPSDESYEFVEMVLKNPEVAPKITDFNVWSDDGDFTQYVLSGNKAILVVLNVEKANQKSISKINNLFKELEQRGIEPLILTSSDGAKTDAFRHEHQLAMPFFFADATVLKTIMRSNPGTFFLEDGKVLSKYHYNDTPEASEVLQRYGK